MDEVKENVNPRGGLSTSLSRRARTLKLGGLQEPRSKGRAGVLAEITTAGNGAGVDPLDWLKGRLSQHHQSVSKSQHELDSGSKHRRKFGSSPAVDGEHLGRVGKASGGLSSNSMGGMAAGREQSSSFVSHYSPSHSRASMLHSHSHNVVDNVEKATKNNRSGGGVQARGAKSPWPASRQVIGIYQHDSVNLQVQRDSSRREANVKALESKSPGAGCLSPKGSAKKSEIEEHSKVGLNPSPKEMSHSKSKVQQDQVRVTQHSPDHSHSSGSSFWNGSKRQGTPYNWKAHRSRNSVVDQPERSSADQQHSSSKKAIRLNLAESQRARSSVTSPSRREISRREVMVDAVEGRSPSALDTLTESASRPRMEDEEKESVPAYREEIKSRIDQQAGDTAVKLASRSEITEKGSQSCEDIKSRIEQHKMKLKRLYSRKLPSVDDSGCSSFPNLHGPLCTSASPMLETEEVASSPDVKVSQFEEEKVQEDVTNTEKDICDLSVDLPHVYPEGHLRDVDHHELGQRIDCGPRSAPFEMISKHASLYSEDSANKISGRRGFSPPPTKTPSASAIIASSGNRKSSGSGAMWSQAAVRYSRSEDVGLEDGLKQNTSIMDVTAVGNDSALLSNEVTGASSSGSSSTPCVMGNSFVNDVTVKSHQSVFPIPSAEKTLSSYRLSTASKLSKNNRRSLGPPLRVLRDEVDSCNSRISSASVAPIITSGRSAVMEVEAAKTSPKLEHSWSDPKKRKAERDLSDGDTSNTLDLRPQDKDSGEFANPPMCKKVVELATEIQSRISVTGSLVQSGNASSLLITAKATTVAACTIPLSRSTPAHIQNEIDASEFPNISCKIRERKPVSTPERAELKLSPVGEAGLSVIQLANEIQSANVVQAGGQPVEGSGTGVPPTSYLEDRRELAVDISHDGFLSAGNKENVPVTVVSDLSNGLNSLSLEEEDMLRKGESKLLSNISDRSSPIPRNLHSSHLKSGESCHAPHSMSHSGRSGVSTEIGARNQVQVSGNLQSNESAEKQPRSSSVSSENPVGELSRNAAGKCKEYNTEAKVRTVPSERAQDSGASAEVQQSAHCTEKGNGQEISAATQHKISENSHFVWVNDKRYQKIGKIGKGGSSEVYKVIDSECNIYAMKKINLKGRDHRAAIGFYQEIEYLEKLRGKRNVIQLIDFEITNRSVVREDYDEEKISEDACIYMILEFGEIDLAGILSKKRKEMMENNEIIDDNWLRFYWKHMLLAVKTIHDERIVHADLKPANFLLVRGELKLIDFGIAKAIQSDTTHIVRDSNNMVGTVNYMSPEALMTNSIDEQGRVVKCGRASDIWSLGCILYQMVYGHTPFSHVASFYAKIQAITSTTHKIDFPAIPDPWLHDVMKKCLIWDRYSRPQITDLLDHPFLRPGFASQQKKVV